MERIASSQSTFFNTPISNYVAHEYPTQDIPYLTPSYLPSKVSQCQSKLILIRFQISPLNHTLLAFWKINAALKEFILFIPTLVPLGV